MQEPSAELQINRDNHIQTSDEFSPRPSQKDNTKGEEEDVVEGRYVIYQMFDMFEVFYE